ncbi:MAG: DUF2065 domain-containing protein [Desulfovibrio sp.]|nr:DUF2065 domain-containing protein [Desulfovibrio sp.]
MNVDLQLLLRALGLAIVLEGLCWAIAPQVMRRMLQALLPLPEQQLRLAGLGAVIVGTAIATLASN